MPETITWAIGQLRREHATIQGLARRLGTSWKTLWRTVCPSPSPSASRTHYTQTERTARFRVIYASPVWSLGKQPCPLFVTLLHTRRWAGCPRGAVVECRVTAPP